MATLLNSIKPLVGIETDETVYDATLELLIKTSIGRMKRAGIDDIILGTGGDGSVVTVGNYKVGQVKVGEIVGTDDTSEYAIEYIAARAKIGLYPDGTSAFYQTLEDQSSQLLTEMYYAPNADEED